MPTSSTQTTRAIRTRVHDFRRVSHANIQFARPSGRLTRRGIPSPSASFHGAAERLLGLDARASELAFAALRPHGGMHRALARYTSVTERADLWLVLVVGGMAVDRQRRPQWQRAVASTAIANVITRLLKRVVQRPRPPIADCPPAGAISSPSFPSTHAATGFAAATAFSKELFPSRTLYGFAASTALARLLLGEHYPSDLVVGAGLGILVAERPIRLFSR